MATTRETISSVPMSSPDITAAEIAAVNQVLQTPYLSIGPYVAAFEAGFAAYIGVRHAAAASSGTAALHMGVIAAGVGRDDLVVTTPFSFVASANVALYEHAVPVFVDIDPVSLNLDPALVAGAAADLVGGNARARERWLPRSLQGAPRSGSLKAIVPVHAFGQPADMDVILETAERHELAVIEDACEALGAEYKHMRVGASRQRACPIATCFAFYPNKQMTTGEGGVIVTDRDDWDALFRSLRNQGRDVFDAWLTHSRLGYNYRLDEMSAALGVTQLSRLEELLAKRDRVARWYNEQLAGVEGVKCQPIVPTTTRMSWFVYTVRLDATFDQLTVINALASHGVPARPYFSPIHLQPFYRERFGYREGDFPVTERISRSTLALPFFGGMTEEQVSYVCRSLQTVLGRS